MSVATTDIYAAQEKVGDEVMQSVQSGREPPTAVQGNGTTYQSYNQSYQSEQNAGPSIVDQLSRTKTKEEVLNKKRNQSISQSKPTEPAPTVEPSRGRAESDLKAKEAPRDVPSMKDAPSSTRRIERSVSPGQLDDGSHVACSGERGEAYSPPGGLNKIKGKLGIGKH